MADLEACPECRHALTPVPDNTTKVGQIIVHRYCPNCGWSDMSIKLRRWDRWLGPLSDFAFKYTPYDAIYGRGTGETERTVSLTWLHRRLVVSWMGPLRRSARRRNLREHAEFDAKLARERYLHTVKDLDG